MTPRMIAVFRRPVTLYYARHAKIRPPRVIFGRQGRLDVTNGNCMAVRLDYVTCYVISKQAVTRSGRVNKCQLSQSCALTQGKHDFKQRYDTKAKCITNETICLIQNSSYKRVESTTAH